MVKTKNIILYLKKQGGANKARATLITYNIDINDKVNTVMLKYRFHKTLHRNIYYTTINKYIGNAKHKFMVIARLTTIKGTLKVANQFV